MRSKMKSKQKNKISKKMDLQLTRDWKAKRKIKRSQAETLPVLSSKNGKENE
jgi:hypothetical protein